MTQHHDDDAPQVGNRSPANRLGLDYRDVPPHRLDTPIIDIHTHVHNRPSIELFFEAADLYGIGKIVTMTPIADAAMLQQRYPGRLDFIAIPNWRAVDHTGEFQSAWLADLEQFAALGARRMKFWMAPPIRGRFGITLRDAFFRPLIDKGLELGMDFMIHVADPSAWFAPGGRYADTAMYGTKDDQYPQLDYLLETVAPRNVIAAHMGGSIEDPDRLQTLLDRHPNLYLDSSATKWIVRGVATQPERIREFMIRNQDRVLFGSDLVVGDGYDFDHYASRYWAHQMMWESEYRGESPIADPDAPDPPRLAGLDLPIDVLRKLYCDNALQLGYLTT